MATCSLMKDYASGCLKKIIAYTSRKLYLGSQRRLFPPVTIFLDLFLCAGYFFNAFD